MRILVCGSRTFSNPWAIHGLLQACVPDPMVSNEPLVVIEGGAKGADAIAAKWAEDSFWGNGWLFHEQFPADWETHGKRAGPIRNQQMLDEGKPDLVLAFLDKARVASRGTNDMITRAENAGLPIVIVQVIPGKPRHFPGDSERTYEHDDE